jgi:hypothetical protein
MEHTPTRPLQNDRLYKAETGHLTTKPSDRRLTREMHLSIENFARAGSAALQFSATGNVTTIARAEPPWRSKTWYRTGLRTAQ